MKNKKALLSAVFAAFMLLSACGGSTQKDTSAQDSSTTSQVASASDMADVEDVVEDGMTPITGDKVKDGTYDVTVDSSSNMFNVTACELTVKNGEMTAKMHMGGTGYLYVYMGTGEEAAAAEEPITFRLPRKPTAHTALPFRLRRSMRELTAQPSARRRRSGTTALWCFARTLCRQTHWQTA